MKLIGVKTTKQKFLKNNISHVSTHKRRSGWVLPGVHIPNSQEMWVSNLQVNS